MGRENPMLFSEYDAFSLLVFIGYTQDSGHRIKKTVMSQDMEEVFAESASPNNGGIFPLYRYHTRPIERDFLR
jgi:hypothetical protein